MKAKELHQMSVSDLKQKISDIRKDLIKHNAQVALGANVKNSMAIRNLKKDIARILTILSEKEGKK
jgi:large subunit ribosomal protein L29